MPGALEQLRARQVSGPDLGVATLELELADQPLHLVLDDRPVRQQQGEAGADVLGEGEELEFAAEPTVVSLLRLLEPLEVLVELVSGREERAVDALQLRAVLVAAPVGAGDAGQLERPDLAGRLNMPAAAEVGEVGVAAETEAVGVGAELVDQLELERLVGEVLARVGDLNLAPDEAGDCASSRVACGARSP